MLGMKGRFIVFEGIDGAGKTTLIGKLVEYMVSEGKKVKTTAEPTSEPIGALIRNGAAGMCQKAEALLFAADRACHTEQISDWMEEGYTVLCDRYYASSMAYQSAGLDGDAADREWLAEINRPIIREPDMTVLLDIDLETSMRRVGERGEASRFEKTEFLRRVRAVYLELASEKGFRVVDASRPEENVFEEVLRIIGE